MSVTKKMIQQLQKEIHDTPQYKESIALAKIALLDYLACYSAGLQSAKRKGLLQASLEKSWQSSDSFNPLSNIKGTISLAIRLFGSLP